MMAMMTFVLGAVRAATHRCVVDGVANVSCFGHNETDATDILQEALDSPATTIFVDGGEYITRPLFVRSGDKHIVMREGVILRAKAGEYHKGSDTVLNFGTYGGAVLERVSVTGETGAAIIMRQRDYDNTSLYTHAEGRHGLRFINVVSGYVAGLTVEDVGGDGVYLNNVTDFRVQRVTVRRGYRNGISLISARGVLLEDVIIDGVNGTNPRSGIDIEPNKRNETLMNITLRRVAVHDVAGCGIEIKHAWALQTHPVSVSVLVENCSIAGVGRSGLPIAPLRAGAKGWINISDVSIADTRCAGVLLGSKASDGAFVTFRGVTLRNTSHACPDSLASYGTFPITLNVSHLEGCGRAPWPPGQDFGGAHFENTSVQVTDANPFFGVTRVLPGGSKVTDVSGVVDVYTSSADALEACSTSLGPLSDPSVTLAARCHREIRLNLSSSLVSDSYSSVLPVANFSTVPVASWCGNASGPLSQSTALAFASRPFVVFEKDMAQYWPPVNRNQELKIADAASAVRAASDKLRPGGPRTQVYMYFTVGSLLPQYELSRWFAARPHLLLHDDLGHIVTTNYGAAAGGRLPLPGLKEGDCPWVDFSQAEAAQAWVNGIDQWVANSSVDGIALDGNPFDDEWIVSVGGSPGVLANVSNETKRLTFLAGVNSSQLELGTRIMQRGGVLMANGVHKPGDNGMLFEEWCDEHSYLRRRNGCDNSTSRIGCDMAVLQQYVHNTNDVVLTHCPDSAAGTSLSASGLLKLAAFLWGAGPRSFFADVPPLKGERAHWQCDEWAAMPKFTEFAKPLGSPDGLGTMSVPGLYQRSFGGGKARVTVDLRPGQSKACIEWADTSKSGSC